MTHTFILDGNPIPLQRARCSRQRKMYDSQKNHKLVAGITLKNQFSLDEPLDGILKLNATFYMPIPKKGCGKKYPFYEGKLQFKKPDLDNLVKFICDVCSNGIIYTDDARIAIIQAEKRYDKNPRTEFSITLLEEL